MTVKILLLIAFLCLGWDKIIVPGGKLLWKGICGVGRGIAFLFAEVGYITIPVLIGCGLITLFVVMIQSEADINPEVARLRSRVYSNAATQTEKIDALQELAKRFPKDPYAQKVIRNRSNPEAEHDKQIREVANTLAKTLPAE